MLKSVVLWISIVFTLTVQAADPPQVVVTLKPIYALVSGVMAGVGTPVLLLQGGESPHTYSMKPSQIKLLHEADLIVWVGPGMEKFLEKLLVTLHKTTRELQLTEIKGLTILKVRQSGAWESHAHLDLHENDKSNPSEQIDSHLWLDLYNAKVIVKAIAETLSQLDTKQASRYQDNAVRLTKQVDQLDQELTAQLAPAKNLPFLVFHDAYQYFEKRYGLTAVGSITLSPEQSPSAKKLHELRTRINQLQVRCVFSEPQFEPGLVTTLIEGTPVRRGILDPLGVQLPTGTEAYFVLLRNLADSLNKCLLAK